jgi:hypothetical protein
MSQRKLSETTSVPSSLISAIRSVDIVLSFL